MNDKITFLDLNQAELEQPESQTLDKLKLISGRLKNKADPTAALGIVSILNSNDNLSEEQLLG